MAKKDEPTLPIRTSLTVTGEIKEMIVKIQGYYGYKYGVIYDFNTIIGTLCEKELESIRSELKQEKDENVQTNRKTISGRDNEK